MTHEKQVSGAQRAPVVALRGAHKSFGAVRALVDATLDIHPGDCIGLVGHNGAGKSTLVNVVNGRLVPESGEVIYRESSASERNDVAARASGIRSVFQELSLCPNLTVLENLRIPNKSLPAIGWRKQARGIMRKALDEIFPDNGISPDASVGDLTIAERQMVEIAIAFAPRDQDAHLVILDEPTSSLDAAIARQLLAHVRSFCAKGGAVIFISHMMGEVFDVASRIVVMKDGTVTHNRPTEDFTRESLVEAMGSVVDQSERAGSEDRELGTEVLRTEQGLHAKQGEIVALAGLAGHGQAEALARFFLSESSDWRMRQTPRVVFVAGDRARDGLMPLWSILQNLSLKTLREFSNGFLVNRGEESTLGQQWREKIGIRTDDMTNPILSLSGGNQQKVLFARALASGAQIVVMDDPMRGVDVGTKSEVYRMIQDEARNGKTFLWYSTETDEILGCDRVFVFRDGEISAELTGDEISEENILRASFEMQEASA